jgi:hypothetical protein
MNKVLDEKGEGNPAQERSMPSQRLYGRSGKLCGGMFTAFRNLPMHVIFLAQERSVSLDYDDENSATQITADLPAGARRVATSSVGVMGRLTKTQVRLRDKETKKVTKKWITQLHVGDSEALKTKDRTYQLGETVRNPTMPKIITAWQSTRRADTEEEE